MLQPLLKTVLVGTAIATASFITTTATPGRSATPGLVSPNASAERLGETIKPFCQGGKPFPFPTKYCPTGGDQETEKERVKKVESQLNEYFQQIRRDMESDKILIPLIQITL